NLAERVDRERRSELAGVGQSATAGLSYSLLHTLTLGGYTHRARKDVGNLATLDRARRLQYDLNFLDPLVDAGTQPEVAYDSSRVRAYVVDLSGLMPEVSAPKTRAHVTEVLERLQRLSQDAGLQADCSTALAALKAEKRSTITASVEKNVNSARTLAFVKAASEPQK